MARARRATEIPADPLDAMLERLQLRGIRDQLDSLLDEAARADLSAHETLILLCEREIARKDHCRIEMRLKLAHFPAVKTLADWRVRGVGPAYARVGRHVRYRPADVDEWLSSRTGISPADVAASA